MKHFDYRDKVILRNGLKGRLISIIHSKNANVAKAMVELEKGEIMKVKLNQIESRESIPVGSI